MFSVRLQSGARPAIHAVAVACAVWTYAAGAAAHSPSDAPIVDSPDNGETTPPAPTWAVRFALGGGIPIGSAQEDILESDGYGGARWGAMFGLSRALSDRFGLGVLIGYGWRSSSASAPAGVVGDVPSSDFVTAGPTYSEELGWFALQGPIELAQPGTVGVTVVPFAGVGFGEVSLHGSGQWQRGVAFGGKFAVFARRAHIGFEFGAYLVPLPSPGAAGGSNDLGMFYLALVGGFDAGEQE